MGGRVVPAQHPQRPQGVPPARRAVGFLEPEVDRAEAAPLQARPGAVDVATVIEDIALALDGVRRERSGAVRDRRRARIGCVGGSG